MPPERHHRGVPIPSFGNGAVSPSVDGSPATTATSTIPSRWKVASLLQLEVSLQHRFRKQKPKTGITVDEFFAVVRKLDWSQTTIKDDTDNKSQQPDNNPHDALVSDLTMEERLLHDLICATADPTMKDPLYQVDLETGTLEPRQSSAEKLKRILASTKTLDTAWSKRVSAMITAHRTAKEQKALQTKKAKESATHKNREVPQKPIQAIITEGMTIDERVHARAKAKQQNLQQQQQQSQESSINNDRTWTIQLADALWTHARSILQRQNLRLPGKLASNSLLQHHSNNKRQRKDPKVSKQCVMTFKDVIQTISKSRIGEASAIQIAKALTELATFTPKWITVLRGTDDTNNGAPGTKKNNKSFKWSPTTTSIFITPENYSAVRSQLTGEPLPTGHSKIIVTQKTTAAVATAKTTATSSSAAPNRKRASPVLAKNLLNDFDTTSNNNNNTVHDAKRVKTTDQPLVQSSSMTPTSPIASKKTVSSALATTNSAQLLLTPVSKKRERDFAAAPKSPTSPTKSPGSKTGSPKRKKNCLRINRNFVIIDEDYAGGTVLPPSATDAASPRALKSLFFKMNAGKRI